MRTAVFAIASARTTARAAIAALAALAVLIGRFVAGLGVGSGCAC